MTKPRSSWQSEGVGLSSSGTGAAGSRLAPWQWTGLLLGLNVAGCIAALRMLGRDDLGFFLAGLVVGLVEIVIVIALEGRPLSDETRWNRVGFLVVVAVLAFAVSLIVVDHALALGYGAGSAWAAGYAVRRLRETGV